MRPKLYGAAAGAKLNLCPAVVLFLRRFWLALGVRSNVFLRQGTISFADCGAYLSHFQHGF
jgi:hypothetical protein